MVRSLIAGACALALGLPVWAAGSSPYQREDIVVTAKRFSQQRVNQPAQLVVIGPGEIRASGAGSVPELLERAAGLRVRSLYGANPTALDLDARGFGETGNSHVLVLLDGRRLNAPDSHAVEHWQALPLARVERIEVQYGSGNVLYGDNAVGAVVNIVTRDRRNAGPAVDLRAGSFGTVQAGAALGLEGDLWRGALDLSLAHTDAFRAHNAADDGSLGGTLRFPLAGGEARVALGYGRLEADLPGYLSLAQAQADPRQSIAANGQGWTDRDTWHVRPGLDLRLGEHARLSGELGFEHARMQGYLSYGGGSFSLVDNRHDTWSLSPRLNLDHPLFGLSADTVLGLDFYRTDYGAAKLDSFAGASRVDMIQSSRGLYAQSSLGVSERVTLTLGARRQWVEQDTRRGGAALDNDHARNAWDLGLSWRPSAELRLFARHGAVFRFAKTDELTTFSGLGTALRPEHGYSSDLGLDWQVGGRRLQATVYRLDLRDEIAYNLATFQNENLQRTRHQGLTLEGRWPLSPSLGLRAGYAYTDATFTDGADRGRRIPLVPRHRGDLALDWKLNDAWTVAASVSRAGEQYFGSDTDNSSLPMAGYTVWDLSATWRRGPWRLQIVGRNLGDANYASSGFEFGSAVYPADGRALYVTLSYAAP